MKDVEKKKIFRELKRLIKKHVSDDMVLKNKYEGSEALKDKPSAHLYGKKELSIMGLPKRKTYVIGVIEQKHFVGFYSMPMYSHPKLLLLKHAELKRARKGKSCLNLTRLDEDMLKELDAHIKKGIALYKKEGWV